MGIVTVFEYNLNVVYPCNIFVIAGGKQAYSSTSGSKPWQMAILVNDVLANYGGGSGAITDSPSVFLALNNVAVGNYNFKLQWTGDGAITLKGTNMMILATQK